MGEVAAKTHGDFNVLKHRKIAIFFATLLTIAK